MTKGGIIALAGAVLAGTLSGCALFGWRNSGPAAGYASTAFVAPGDDAEASLRQLARAMIESEHHEGDTAVPVIRRRPYYMREYVMYPDGPDGFEIELRESDSKTRPLIGEVSMNKIRYATRMHRKHNRAAGDTDFLRDTGKQTMTFELRNSRWTRIGSIFVAEKTEEQADGAWVPRREETRRVIPEEDRPGWFGRLWQRIRGGE